METIFQYQSSTSDDESDNEIKLNPQLNTAINLKSFEEKNKLSNNSNKTTNQCNFEKSSLNPQETKDNGKKIKGYVSKRIKLQEVNEKNLESQQKEKEQISPDSNILLPFRTNLLDLPNRIQSALDEKQDVIHKTIPKKQIISLPKEHTKGINILLWCGSFGQVLASASMDGTVRIWDVFRSKECVRVINHDGAVKDAKWDNFRNNILSGGYDKTVKLTNIETGTLIQSFPHPQVVTSLRYHPKQPNVFVSGMMKDGIRTWDLRSNKVVKESRKFWGSVNDLEFFPDGINLLCCSDYVVRNSSDKNIMVWDINSMTSISNQIYQEAFSCTALRMHPLHTHFVAQSNGNYIAIFSNEKPWRLDKRKRYEGHLVNGYPIRCNFSLKPDPGRYLVSGDANGRLFFYDWFSSRIVKIMEDAHKDACTDACWHPLLNGMVASCGWDGKLKIWR